MPPKPSEPRTRRDVVLYAALAFAGVGAAATTWPLMANLAPNPASPRRRSRVELAGIEPGDTRIISWDGQPVAIRHRLTAEIEAAQIADISVFRDKLARVADSDAKTVASDRNRTKPGQSHWLVVLAICPRNRCLVKPLRPDEDRVPSIAWICPCDACRFDTSGRVVGGPALENLAVPPYRFVGTGTIEIGMS